MKNTVIVILAVLFLLQIGCTKAIRYSEDEIKGFSPNVQENIRKGQIDLGMTQEQVRYAWGGPDSIKMLEPFEGKPREEWIYSSAGTMGVIGTKLLLFYNNKLIFISK
jgi:outer membrane protein assembly factor BamE (lipoprotein component of BamABCDE complex)